LQCVAVCCSFMQYVADADFFACYLRCVTWLLHVTWRVTWLLGAQGAWPLHMRHDSVKWDMTHWYETWLIDMRHDSFTWDMPLVEMSRGTCIHESWHTHVYMSHDTHMHESCQWLVHMRHATRINESWHTYIRVMTHIYMSHIRGVIGVSAARGEGKFVLPKFAF